MALAASCKGPCDADYRCKDALARETGRVVTNPKQPEYLDHDFFRSGTRFQWICRQV